MYSPGFSNKVCRGLVRRSLLHVRVGVQFGSPLLSPKIETLSFRHLSVPLLWGFWGCDCISGASLFWSWHCLHKSSAPRSGTRRTYHFWGCPCVQVAKGKAMKRFQFWPRPAPPHAVCCAVWAPWAIGSPFSACLEKNGRQTLSVWDSFASREECCLPRPLRAPTQHWSGGPNGRRRCSADRHARHFASRFS